MKRLKALLAGGAAASNETDAAEKLRLATAALLMEAACMDGHIDDAETGTVIALLTNHFELSVEEATELAEAGRQTVSESNELYGFTRTIKDNFDHNQRIQMIEMLWRVVYADGQLHDYEANLLRRVTGLIYVSDRDSGSARKRVLEQLDLSPSNVP
ncbi:MAG: TerB family tellurite resistance protein [Rhodospirillaceae bacterium]|nr:TerB family tellurite resistance protein [Rhodospirillaceae bacterium]MBT5014465.1 TerB family tellurite resistance protein [Rhodospirillaceae bacterium]MBT7355310.1 TerB family tellurite resistance protein [Rhodospirillaceae bacterium]